MCHSWATAEKQTWKNLTRSKNMDLRISFGAMRNTSHERNGGNCSLEAPWHEHSIKLSHFLKNVVSQTSAALTILKEKKLLQINPNHLAQWCVNDDLHKDVWSCHTMESFLGLSDTALQVWGISSKMNELSQSKELYPFLFSESNIPPTLGNMFTDGSAKGAAQLRSSKIYIIHLNGNTVTLISGRRNLHQFHGSDRSSSCSCANH